MELTPDHRYRDPRLQKGMSDPKNVVQNLDLFAHGGNCNRRDTHQPVEAAGAALLSE
jgi:hypothetical protein